MGSLGDQERGYNGWTNYETWAVALWIGNEPGSYEYWEHDQAEDCYRAAVKAQLGDFEFEPGATTVSQGQRRR